MKPEGSPKAIYGVSAAFRRLCVETVVDVKSDDLKKSSRLQAAVC